MSFLYRTFWKENGRIVTSLVLVVAVSRYRIVPSFRRFSFGSTHEARVDACSCAFRVDAANFDAALMLDAHVQIKKRKKFQVQISWIQAELILVPNYIV